MGLVGNCAEVLPELLRRGVIPDVLTDQTSAHDALNGYVPAGPLAGGGRGAARGATPTEYVRRAMESMRAHCEAMVEMMRRGAVTFDYGNNLRGQAREAGFADAFAFPGFVPAYVRPLFCRGQGPLPLGGALRRPGGHLPHRRAGAGALPGGPSTCAAGSRRRGRRCTSRGCPARICWLGQGERARFGVALNDLVASGELKAPRSSSAATTWTPARWPRPTARRRR